MLDVNNRKLRFQVMTTRSPILGKDACVDLKLISRVDAVKVEEGRSIIDFTKKLVTKYDTLFHGLRTIKVNATKPTLV